MSCDIVENPSLEQIDEGLKKIDAIMILHSIDLNEIREIVDFYKEYEDFNIAYIHKYTKGKKETVFGMKRCF